MDVFVALKFLSYLVVPPASTVFGVALGIVLFVSGLRRTGTSIAVLAVLYAIVLSQPIVGDALNAPLERRAREDAERAAPCCYSAIVLLGGPIEPAAPPVMPTSHLVAGADRIVYAAELFHRGVAPRIIASGGRLPLEVASESEADAMKGLLIALGVPAEAIVTEGSSLNTVENVAFVRRLVGEQPVALVTSAYHMPRAMKLARASGLNASAFPTDWQLQPAVRPSWENWLPSNDAERMSSVAIREYLALAFDRRQVAPAPK
jgi:uncharacterized SAM-binding protein YcdF (DUF218 family)